jgi:hypothetical protein
MAELDFRDGKRGVPEHVERLLTGVPTYKMTYAEALEFMNRRLQYDYVENVHSKIINNALRGQR